MPMRTIVTALALLAQTSSIFGQQPAFVVGEKVAGSVGFYDAQFKRLGGVKVGVHPHEMWLSADKRTLYVADNGVLWMTETGPGENTVSVIDIPSQRRTAVIDLGQFRRPHGITFDEASGRVWVTTEQPSQLLSVDPVKRQILRRYDVQGKAPHIVNIGLGGWAFSSNTDTGTVAAINTDSGEVRLISSGARPQGQATVPRPQDLVRRELRRIVHLDSRPRTKNANRYYPDREGAGPSGAVAGRQDADLRAPGRAIRGIRRYREP